MAVGKRLRFQIFRRDNFACRYCGLTAADGAVLEVDHITPQSDGGKDVPTNLITACESCNSGKSDIPLNAPTVADVPQADFRAAMEERGFGPSEDSEDPELAEWVSDAEIAAAVAWRQGFPNAPMRETGKFAISFAIAIATGHEARDVEMTAYYAGQEQKSWLLSYLAVPPVKEEPEEEAAYHDAVAFLRRLTPWERKRMIWRARAGAGDYCPTIPELIRAAAGYGERYVEEGRDMEALERWLNCLPGNEGSLFLMRATAEWDAHWQGHRAHSAFECRDEVLTLAVSLALGTEVPA